MSELIPEVKSALDGIRSSVEGFNSKFDKIQEQVDAIDSQLQRKGAGGGFGNSGSPAAEIVKKFMGARADFDRYKTFSFEIPSPTLNAKTITSTGLYPAAAAGQIGNAGGYGYGAVRALFRAVPIDTGSVFQVREDAATGWNASPQSEGLDKNESITTLSGETIPVQTVAHWVAATKQALDDVAGLEAFLNNRLLWGLAAEVEAQIISGSGAGTNLDGLTTQATAFDTGLLWPSEGWDTLTVLGAAATQCRVAGYNPNFAVMHPTDAFRMRFLRDSTGQFIAGPPALPPIVESVAMAQGYFVLGDSSQATVRVRQMATVDFSESHSDYFTKNKVAIRAEERLALQMISPKAFIYGALTFSPA